jgi:DNA-binding CsgD family transcriptional regulator
MKSENYEICQQLMISYMKVVVKLLSVFHNFVTYDN